MLRSQGVAGEVRVRYVVGTAGRVELRTFEVLASTHDLFTAAVKRALPGWHFTPARRGDRTVASAREERFVFRIPSDLDRPELESVVLVRDTAPDGLPRTVIGPPPPDPDAATAFTDDDLLAVQRAVVLEVATGYRKAGNEPAPHTVCVTLDRAGEGVDPDAALLAWLGAAGGRTFVTRRDCPPTYASMVLLVDSLGQPVRRGPPGWVDPLVVTIMLVKPWTADVVFVKASGGQGLGGRYYRCTVTRAAPAWRPACLSLGGWVH